jgi:hypothetical protein
VDNNKNGKYDRGALLTFISIYTCFGYEAEETDLFLALLLESGDIFTYNTLGAWAPGAWPVYSTFVSDNFAYAIHVMTLRFFHGFPLVDQNIGFYAVMAPANHVLDQPWDALTGQTIRLTDSQ